jgi:glycosyltransferase involved in cell wall biosynthesis
MQQAMQFVVVGNLPRYGIGTKALPKHGNVLFTGRQPSHMIPDYLSAADVLLLPQEPVPSSEARWPIRFGDYLAAGRPIVTPRIGEISKVVESANCGVLTRPGDPKDLAHKLVSISSDQTLRERLGRNARTFAEKELSWEILAARLGSFYRKLYDVAT